MSKSNKPEETRQKVLAEVAGHCRAIEDAVISLNNTLTCALQSGLPSNVADALLAGVIATDDDLDR